MKLSHTEFKLLYFLMANAHRLVSNDDLILRVWGAEFLGNGQSTYLRALLAAEDRGDPRFRPILSRNVVSVYVCVPWPVDDIVQGAKKLYRIVWTSGPTE